MEPEGVRSCFEDEPEQVKSFLDRDRSLDLDIRLSSALLERMALDSVGLYSNVSIDFLAAELAKSRYTTPTVP